MAVDLRETIRRAGRTGEPACLRPLLDAARLDARSAEAVRAHALALAAAVRERGRAASGIEALLAEYDLSNAEGVLLMCLAEALLRIPDEATARRLLRDKLARGEWARHLGTRDSLLVNASTWGLLLTGRYLAATEWDDDGATPLFGGLFARLGDATLQAAIERAMRWLAGQFVMGADLQQALARARPDARTRYSYDCLGEAARTAADARRYFAAYREAIAALAPQGDPHAPLAAPGISVKLSALHPRYEYAQAARVHAELAPRLRELACAAREAGIGLTLDAEEAERLEPMLDLFEGLYTNAALRGWEGLGIAVQAYQKRARAVLAWLAALARGQGRRIPVRLVKGAYWDSEIKRAQERGLDGYPVFTRKAATDVSYLACARDLLAAPEAFYPQFATHNAYAVAYVLHSAAPDQAFEFQRLHGMGETLYAELERGHPRPLICRVYAPVGDYAQLLPYLVRRLLENGANSSFVNQLARSDVPLEELVRDPVAQTLATAERPAPDIPLPRELFAPARRNSLGDDLSDPGQRAALLAAVSAAAVRRYTAAPLIDGDSAAGAARPVFSPARGDRQVGDVIEADAAAARSALDCAAAAAPVWDAVPAGERAASLDRAADALEARRAEFAALVAAEGGRCLIDALAEVREAVDFCRYYAAEARRLLAEPLRLPGPTGEDNRLALHGRGVFLCISPWNFPLSIFTGQVAAALAAGNAVIAKPARQTPLVAAAMTGLLHAAGIPPAALNLLPGSGAALGAQLLADARIAGVAFTGSTATAWTLQEALARRRGAIVPLIAETGGINVMIADSSALIEQLVGDVLASAFNSAGQRCSALRALFVQSDIAEPVLDMLAGALDELRLGDPLDLATDVGPVIDSAARDALAAHARRMRDIGRLVHEATLPRDTAAGSFFAPRIFEIDRLELLEEEVFGPILHVVRFEADDLDAVIDAVNATGFGLTLGLHSRIETTWQRVRERARAGNLYINRNMIGAVVGSQPFGGEGLSGTGPKAGGPFYLPRFALERTVTVNTAAIGGNPELLRG
jgi:RHH-type proline utilization regulon transcriptional repressor/proline dehydrogenase/delta 1-pyrroline-5-carboxylate dehydrogenase